MNAGSPDALAQERRPGRGSVPAGSIVRVLLAALAVLAGTARCGPSPHAQAGAPRPNVLLLVMDTTRGDRCSFNGYSRPTTPRLAEFAKDAVVFRDAWTPAAWTGPAHASLFTGLRPENHGFNDGTRQYLGPSPQTLAEAFSAAGYATACLTNNEWIAPEFGLTRGFTTVESLYRDEKRAYPWAKQTHLMGATWAEAAHAAGHPFFLFVNDMEPHMPYTPLPEDQHRFAAPGTTAADIEWARVFGENELFQYTKGFQHGVVEYPDDKIGLLSDLYDAEVAGLDREIGVLLDRLREDGLLDDTVVVICGDHGESFGEHHMLGHKYDLHRAIRHVPLIIRKKCAMDGGRLVDSVVRLEDVPPTLYELCGLTVPPRLDGKTLTGALDGRIARGIRGPSEAMHGWMNEQAPDFDASSFAAGIDSVYDGRWHLLTYTDGRRELYDVKADPAEATNLSAREPGEVERLRALLAR
jgi:arylsulfatase A-like enzyme